MCWDNQHAIPFSKVFTRFKKLSFLDVFLKLKKFSTAFLLLYLTGKKYWREKFLLPFLVCLFQYCIYIFFQNIQVQISLNPLLLSLSKKKSWEKLLKSDFFRCQKATQSINLVLSLAFMYKTLCGNWIYFLLISCMCPGYYWILSFVVAYSLYWFNVD